MDENEGKTVGRGSMGQWGRTGGSEWMCRRAQRRAWAAWEGGQGGGVGTRATLTTLGTLTVELPPPDPVPPWPVSDPV